MAQTLYNDLFLRMNLTDNGYYPRTGTASSSPDIIPFGTVPYKGDTQAYFSGNYDSDVGQNIFGQQLNYPYLRAKNLSAGATTGKGYLSYATSSLLMWPSIWSAQQYVLKTELGADHVNFNSSGANKVAVGDSPLVWTPSAPPGSDHYCLVSRLTTAAHPNPIPANFATFQDYVNWIMNNPATAWRNVSYVVNNPPTWQQQVKLDWPVAAGNLLVQLKCTNVPIGASVAFSCGTPGPNPLLVLDRTNITTYPSQTMGIYSLIPANFSGVITVSYWSNGKPATASPDITLQAINVVGASHQMARHYHSLEELGVHGPANALGTKHKFKISEGDIPMGYVAGSQKFLITP